jgi:hypothetical protein
MDQAAEQLKRERAEKREREDIEAELERRRQWVNEHERNAGQQTPNVRARLEREEQDRRDAWELDIRERHTAEEDRRQEWADRREDETHRRYEERQRRDERER